MNNQKRPVAPRARPAPQVVVNVTTPPELIAALVGFNKLVSEQKETRVEEKELKTRPVASKHQGGLLWLVCATVLIVAFLVFMWNERTTPPPDRVSTATLDVVKDIYATKSEHAGLKNKFDTNALVMKAELAELTRIGATKASHDEVDLLRTAFEADICARTAELAKMKELGATQDDLTKLEKKLDGKISEAREQAIKTMKKQLAEAIKKIAPPNPASAKAAAIATATECFVNVVLVDVLGHASQYKANAADNTTPGASFVCRDENGQPKVVDWSQRCLLSRPYREGCPPVTGSIYTLGITGEAVEIPDVPVQNVYYDVDAAIYFDDLFGNLVPASGYVRNLPSRP